MPVSHKDRYQLSQDAAFLSRVQASLITACVAISNEAYTPSFPARHNFAAQILNNPNGTPNWAQLFCYTVATDAACIGAATGAGTVALTPGNVAAQAANVTDAQIDAAVSGQFNAFIRVPG